MLLAITFIACNKADDECYSCTLQTDIEYGQSTYTLPDEQLPVICSEPDMSTTTTHGFYQIPSADSNITVEGYKVQYKRCKPA